MFRQMEVKLDRMARFGIGLVLVTTVICGQLFGCASPADKISNRRLPALASTASIETDPYIWLENTADPAVRPWVDRHNQKVAAVLENDPRAGTLALDIRKILTAQDRIPAPTLANGNVRNFWQDAAHPRGLWRQTSLREYAKSNPKWTTLLDIDALNAAEKKSWVFEKAICLPPANDRCLIQLSDGGRDEAEVREFKISAKAFVKDGFSVPAAKTDVAWYDLNTLVIGSNFGPGTLTSSEYPRQVKLWHRGESLAQAKLIFEGKDADVSVTGTRTLRPESGNLYMNESLSFFTSKNFQVTASGQLQLLPFPETSSFEGEFKGYLFASLKKDWTINGATYVAGTVLSLPVAKVSQPDGLNALEVVFTPSAKSAFTEISFTRDFAILSILNNVHGELWRVSRGSTAWEKSQIALPKGGTIGLQPTDAFDSQNRIFAQYESFSTPPSLYFGDGKDFSTGLKVVKTLSPKYDAKNVVVEQFESKSKDGTAVPYFVVHQKNYRLDGKNPTLLYAYGGFEVAETPSYLGTFGKVWLEKGGVYVLANIRGGGEFGPAWHSAGVKENRQLVYDDFASVAEDLVSRKITNHRRLGIEGGSNGGLLVGVAMTQHPDYYNAVVCESALLDMIRYTKLPPGASWIGEYGDPEDPKMASYIMTYSPYQNIRTGVAYPKAFFHISTADDRVQPGHTRKMVARMEQDGNDVLMFENTEGGHGGAADIEQRVRKATMEFTYLYQQLLD